MSYYRTYRPQTIDEIDNISVRDRLLSLLTKDKKELPHAFLLSGPKGAGKTTAARLIAKLFNCEKPDKKKGPCGACSQCQAIAKGTSLDVLEIDAASNRGIDEMRLLRERIGLRPGASDYTVYIIDEVHMLTTEAFNALLKTLEEPPGHAVFLLATTDPQKVPLTIHSRCVEIPFSKAQPAELLVALSRIVKKEHIDIEKEALSLIVLLSDGAFRDAVKMLEQVSFEKGPITAEIVRRLLSASESKDRETLLALLQQGNAREALELIAKLTLAGKDLRTFLTDCLLDLEAMLVQVVEGEENGWKQNDIIDLIRRFERAYSEMKAVAISQLPLELAVVEFCFRSESDASNAPSVDRSSVPASRAPGREKPASIPDHKKETKEPEADGTDPGVELGNLTLEKLTDHWGDFLDALKPFNHSVAGVLRSSRPKSVGNGVVVIEAFYTFHKERLSEGNVRDTMAKVLNKLFGEKVKIDIVLGKK